MIAWLKLLPLWAIITFAIEVFVVLLAVVRVVTHYAHRYSVRWSNVGNLYYVGHDLMSVVATLDRNEPTKQIISGLRQVTHHLYSCGFDNSTCADIIKALQTQTIKLEAQPTQDNPLPKDLNEGTRQLLLRIHDGIAQLAKDKQGKSYSVSTPENMTQWADNKARARR